MAVVGKLWIAARRMKFFCVILSARCAMHVLFNVKMLDTVTVGILVAYFKIYFISTDTVVCFVKRSFGRINLAV